METVTKEKLPNAKTSLVLGICSLLIGLFGIIPGVLGIYLALQGRKLYNEDKEKYDNYKQLNAGFILSIIGTALAFIFLIAYIDHQNSNSIRINF